MKWGARKRKRATPAVDRPAGDLGVPHPGYSVELLVIPNNPRALGVLVCRPDGRQLLLTKRRDFVRYWAVKQWATTR